MISSDIQSECFEVDMPRPNEKPTCIGAERQEGDCRVQESDWTSGWLSRAVYLYCEAAFSFLESYGMEDESYFLALIRMYDQSLKYALNLPLAERSTYFERLDKLRSRARHVGWGVEEELNSLWYAAELDGPKINGK